LTEEQTQLQRLRIIFGKLGSQKYIGHLDLARTWERILRRAEISLAYTQGFNARPRMQLATALPLGITSECEILDIWLDKAFPIEGLAERLMAVSPPGLPIYSVEEIPLKAPAVHNLLESSVYVITPHDNSNIERLRQRVEALMAKENILRVRRDKPYDLRPLLKSAEVDTEGKIRVEMVLTEQSAGRADELLDELGFTVADVALHRAEIKLKAG
jgi:radical SAM-linked protein